MRIARRGFSLVELLVVIGIIAVLAGILIPVVTAARNSAHEASSKAMISSLSSAIEMYHTTFHTYPGAFRNDDLIAGNIRISAANPAVVSYTGGGGEAVTMTESLTLALLGGLTLDPTNTAIHLWDENLTKSAAGPDVLNPNAVKRYQAFMQAKPGATSGGLLSSLEDHGTEYAAAGDSRIPEFLDAFPDKLPIIYLRAKVGAAGIVALNNSPNANCQYDLQNALPYLRSKDGIREVGTTWEPANTAGLGTKDNPYDGFSYFRHPQLGGTFDAAGNLNGTPRQKDTFILISAGKDRIFGTRDDITNFGPIGE